MTTQITRRGLFGLAAATLVAAGCSSNGGATDPDVPTVFATTIVWGSIAEAVGGDAAKVTASISSPDQDPHDYEATAQDKLLVSQAAVVVVNGGGYDAWAQPLLESVDNDPSVVNAFVLSEYPEGANEHVFYDLDTAMAVARQVATALGEVNPAQAQTYTSNADNLVAELEALRKRATDWAAANGGAKVVSTESVAEYLLDDLGLTDVTPADYIRQSEAESGPSVAVIEATRQLIGTEAQVLIVNGQTEDAVSNRLVQRANETGAKVIKVYETFPEGTTDYVSFIGAAVDSLTE
ncbi:metal ABC transporter solute-binding protein, Zn/Mn family [Aestuariimicrobium sp. Y1814]|uniref:metal ABC transporter solute-binding protein, Zn/Mn family n=1 Tax=Aestuariimicrobium sp. Y1814 TaxID=3418742 RepID=UPI003DA72472